MKKVLWAAGIAVFMISCGSGEQAAPASEEKAATSASVDLPYTAGYTSNWNNEVSDADLKTVLMSYKDWSDGNMEGLKNALADSVEFDRWDGEHFSKTSAELVAMWAPFRDSLSSISISMDAWAKMHAVDKGDSYITVWYKEIDTYKDGRVDSTYWHDINQVKNGKITWYAQYRRPAK